MNYLFDFVLVGTLVAIILGGAYSIYLQLKPKDPNPFIRHPKKDDDRVLKSLYMDYGDEKYYAPAPYWTKKTEEEIRKTDKENAKDNAIAALENLQN